MKLEEDMNISYEYQTSPFYTDWEQLFNIYLTRRLLVRNVLSELLYS